MSVKITGGVAGAADASIKGAVNGVVRGILNRGIATAYLNENGELVLVMTDKQTINLGVVVGRGVYSVNVDGNGHLVVVMTDGTITDAGNVKGVGVKDVYIRPDNHLIVSLTDGTEIDAGVVADNGLSDEIKEILLYLSEASLYFEDVGSKINRLRELFGQIVPIGKTYNVTLNLTNTTADHPGGEVSEGSGLAVNLSAAYGYELDTDSIVVTMGGVDVTSSVLSGNRIEILTVTGDVVISAVAVAVGAQTWSVQQLLFNFKSDVAQIVTVNNGDQYRSQLSPTYGYKLEGAEVTVTMGGKDVTSSFYADGVVYIPSVTGNVEIYAYAAEMVKYTITKSLLGHTLSNNVTEVYEGHKYSTKVTMQDGYTNPLVKVLMGGVNITSSAYQNGIVYISAVTGNVVVSAIAVELEWHPVSYSLTDTTSSNKAETVREGGSFRTELAPVDNYSITEVSVTMGENDITSRVYQEGMVDIQPVTGAIHIAAVSRPYQNVYLYLTGCTANNPATEVKYGEPYVSRIYPNSGYEIGSVLVYMGDVDITSKVVSMKGSGIEMWAEVSIPAVTGEVTIVAQSNTGDYSWVNIGVETINCHCTVSDGDLVQMGGQLVGKFIPDANYSMHGAEVCISMGWMDITNTVYNANTFEFIIPNITGEITIFARAINQLS